MARFLLRRLLWFGVTLTVVMGVSFFLMKKKVATKQNLLSEI